MAITLKNASRKIWLDTDKLTKPTCFNEADLLMRHLDTFREAIVARDRSRAQNAHAAIGPALGATPWNGRFAALGQFITLYPTMESFERVMRETAERFNEVEVLGTRLVKAWTQLHFRFRTNDIVQPIDEAWHAETRRVYGDVPMITNLGKIDIFLTIVKSSLYGLQLSGNPWMKYVPGTGDGRIFDHGRTILRRIANPDSITENAPHYHSNYTLVTSVPNFNTLWHTCWGHFGPLVSRASQRNDIPGMLSACLDLLHSWGPHSSEAHSHPWDLTRGTFASSETPYTIADHSCAQLCGRGVTRGKGLCTTCGNDECVDTEHDKTRYCPTCSQAYRCDECKVIRKTGTNARTFTCYGPCGRNYLCMSHCVDQRNFLCNRCLEEAQERIRIAAEKEKARIEAVEAEKKSAKKPKPKPLSKRKPSSRLPARAQVARLCLQRPRLRKKRKVAH